MMLLLHRTIRVFLLIVSLSIPISIFSQEIERIDTSGYMTFSFGSNFTEVLNFNLMVAASKGYVSEIQRIIKNGADPDCKTNEKVTPLIYAVANNRLDAVKVLLTYDIDVNVMTTNWETPLLIAVKNGNVDIAEALIRDSADIKVSDKFGVTPLHYASIYGYFYMVDMLLYYQAAVYSKTNDGTTPLMAAVWAGYSDISDLLIQNGADPEEKDNLGFTPFLIAAQNGDTVIMEMLIKRNIELYEVNSFNYNALDIAIKSNQKEAVEYLLKKGDKWTSNKNNPVSPYLVAAKYTRKEIAELLAKNNIPKTYKFGFDQVGISASFRNCFYDYFTGLGISLKEPSVNAGIFMGLDVKPGYTRVLLKESESLYYQYFNKSSMVYAGLFKDFAITDFAYGGNWIFSGSLAAGYTYGNKLKGTSMSIKNKFRIIPGVALKWTSNNLNFSGSLDYIKSEFYKVGPLWLRLGVSYNIFFDNTRAPGKDIKWINH